MASGFHNPMVGVYDGTLLYEQNFHDQEVKSEIAIAMCVIPKGSEYYENCFGEIVSDNIKFVGARVLTRHSVDTFCFPQKFCSLHIK